MHRARRGVRDARPKALPGVVQRDGLAAAAESLAAADATMQTSVAAAEPAPGDEAQVEEMAAADQEASDLTAQAVRCEVRERRRPLLSP